MNVTTRQNIQYESLQHTNFTKTQKETMLGLLAYRMEKLACPNLLRLLTNNAKEKVLMHSLKLSNFGLIVHSELLM